MATPVFMSVNAGPLDRALIIIKDHESWTALGNGWKAFGRLDFSSMPVIYGPTVDVSDISQLDVVVAVNRNTCAGIVCVDTLLNDLVALGAVVSYS